jgi:hypothetical protein
MFDSMGNLWSTGNDVKNELLRETATFTARPRADELNRAGIQGESAEAFAALKDKQFPALPGPDEGG